jgi:hypothetical protein
MTDPLGLSAQQRWQSDRTEALEAFVAKYGERIQLATDGMWYVRDGDRMLMVDLPPWPKDDPVRPATLAEAYRVVGETVRKL